MRILLIILLLAGPMMSAFAQALPDAVLGEWLTPRKDSRIQIYREGSQYFGKVVWGSGATKDEKNPDPALQNRALVGLVMLNNLKFDGTDTWANGTIYDPREGKTYACKMALNDARSLRVRGYIGVSLFGRTEVWSRVR